MMNQDLKKIICALDVSDKATVLNIIEQTGSMLDYYKVGLKLFTQCGPDIIQAIHGKNKKIFLDLKFHDIPNTVADAVEAACELGVDMLTLHTWGGKEMLQFAVDRAKDWSDKNKKKKPLLLGVTVLTSMNDLGSINVNQSIEAQVQYLSNLAVESKLDGIVCSPQDILFIKQKFPQLKLICPGIRPQGAEQDDQKRVMTPREAIELGADYLVIGRPLLLANDPQIFLKNVFK